MKRVEVRFGGSGGQGVVLAGVILAEAAILSGRNAAQSQVYGPESRGGASRSDVVVADGEIGFPKAQALDVLVAFTQEACERYSGSLRPDGLLLADERIQPPDGPWTARSLPFVETARAAAGSPLSANVVALGALAGLTGVVETGALRRAVEARIRPRSRDRNLRALDAGLRLVGEA